MLSGFLGHRGRENRTPTKGFGDPYHTIWPIPYLWFTSDLKLFTYLQNRIHIKHLFSCWVGQLKSVSNKVGHLVTVDDWLRNRSLRVYDTQCLLLRKCPSVESPHVLNASIHSTRIFSIRPLSKLFGQALDRLVTVSSIHYCTSTSALSTSSSSRGLINWDISSWGGLHA